MRSGSSHCDLQLAKMKHEEYDEEEAGKFCSSIEVQVKKCFNLV